MMQVNITPKGRTVLRFSMEKPRTEVTVSKRLSERERRLKARQDRLAREIAAREAAADAFADAVIALLENQR